MSKTQKNISDNVAREVTKYLLRQGCFTQTEIAELVKRSQSWVSGIKREENITSLERKKKLIDFNKPNNGNN